MVISSDLDARIANVVDGAVAASLNNKFGAIASNIFNVVNQKVDAKLKQSFGNDLHTSTSNSNADHGASMIPDLSNMLVPRVPLSTTPIHHTQSQTVIGNSVGGGVPAIHTNASMTHPIIATSTPSNTLDFSSAPQASYTLPNFIPSTSPASMPTHRPSIDDVERNNFVAEIQRVVRETFGLESKIKARTYQKPYPEN